MNIISTNITTYPLGCSCQIFLKCFFVEVTDDVGLIPISVLKNHQAKLPPAGHISAEELEQEHPLAVAGLLDQRGGEGGFFDDFFHGMSPKLGDFTNKYDQTESNFCYGWYFDKHLSKPWGM